MLGIPCIGLNGGPESSNSEAFSFQITADDQEETDRYRMKSMKKIDIAAIEKAQPG